MGVESRRGGAQRGQERPREQQPDASRNDASRPGASGQGSSAQGSPGRGAPRGGASRGGASGRGGSAAGRPQADKLTGLLEPVIRAEGFDLEEVVVTPVGRRRLVRVVIDGDNGVSLDDVALVSRSVSDALDENDVMGAAPYVLEVTSPGVDRPLTEPRHWRRAAGRLVRVALVTGGDIEGRVITADDQAVVIDIDGEQRRIELHELGRGRVQVEFRRTGDAPDADADDDADVEPDED